VDTGSPEVVTLTRGIACLSIEGVKLHIPMIQRFLPVWQTGPIDIPGIFRVGSVEIRRPGAFAYVDGIA
jgi:hypothetical protein